MMLKRILKGRKLVRFDGVTRMDETRVAKNRFQSEPEGRRKVWRPKMR
jgi:hypothetical protein